MSIVPEILIALQLEPAVVLCLTVDGPVLSDECLRAYPGTDFDDQLQPYRSTRVFTWRQLAAAFYCYERNGDIRACLSAAIRAMDKHMDSHGLTRVLAYEQTGLVPELAGV